MASGIFAENPLGGGAAELVDPEYLSAKKKTNGKYGCR
jgi:hypothetical protein